MTDPLNNCNSKIVYYLYPNNNSWFIIPDIDKASEVELVTEYNSGIAIGSKVSDTKEFTIIKRLSVNINIPDQMINRCVNFFDSIYVNLEYISLNISSVSFKNVTFNKLKLFDMSECCYDMGLYNSHFP